MFGKTEIIRLSVDGMRCEHCKKRVEDALKAVKGVKKVAVSLENASAQIEVAAGKVDGAALAGSVNAAGFEAKVIE